jgi:prepilin-type N-terminal cleavage/methylation domain-containing protein
MRTQRGFTLIELMISLVLFSFAIAGALSIAVSLTNGYREQRQAIETEQSVRSPMDYMTDAIRSASPAMPGSTCVGAPATYMPQVNCISTTPTLIIDANDTTTCPTPSVPATNGIPAITVTNSTTASDTLDVIYAAGGVVTMLQAAYSTTGAGTGQITVWNTAGILPGDDLMLVDPSSSTNPGWIVHVATTWVNPGTTCPTNPGTLCQTTISLVTPLCNPSTPLSYTTNTLVIRVKRAHFYIDTTNYGVPTLMMDPLTTGLSAEPLAENIEDMQVALGIDANKNGNIETGEWEYSSGDPAGLTGTVRSVRITLTAQASQKLIGYAAATAFFLRAAEDRPAAAVGDPYRRRVLTSTVEIRNTTGSP